MSKLITQEEEQKTILDLTILDLQKEIINFKDEAIFLKKRIEHTTEGSLDVEASNEQLIETNQHLTLIVDNAEHVSKEHLKAIKQLNNTIKLLTNELRTTQHRIINLIKEKS